MASYNKVILMGNLTRDPEMRVTASGLSICKFGIAVSRKFKTADGEMKEETTFVDIDSFGRQAETISKYMAKGRPIHLEGRLKLDQWETQQGEKRSKLGVILESFQFVGSRNENEGVSHSADDGNGASASQLEQSSPPPRTTQPAATASAPGTSATAQAPADDIDEDVPF